MTKELVLRYSHNIVEHLGLKLYQNQPTRVIAELVSNSWDVDATENQVNLEMTDGQRWVAVLDNGHGMTRDDLVRSYLVIGHPKRSRPQETSRSGRPLMGRKGIGKLAAFGIARYVDVVTAAKIGEVVKVVWLRFDRDALLGKGEEDNQYRPIVIADAISLSELPLTEDITGQVRVWQDLIKGGCGTAIIMTDLSVVKSIGQERLINSLGTRFTLTVSGKMAVKVNGERVDSVNALPKFEFRIPQDGVIATRLPDGREIKYWVGFVESATWPQDQAGVGVYAHGKIAQDRPFVFGLKGREIFTRYMFGVVEADWLDELDKDIISTDRTSINWEIDEVAALHSAGQSLARDWIGQYEKWRQTGLEREARKIYEIVAAKGAAQRVTPAEEAEIVQLATKISGSFDKGQGQAKEDLVAALSEAWVQKPMRKLVTDLWSSFSEDPDAPPEVFTRIVQRLSESSVPESLNLAVVFAQRAFALTRLQDYVLHGSETDLQKLIERFPWIIEPDSAVLTANKTLKSSIEKAVEHGQIPTGRRIVNDVSDNKKPDFVFLGSPGETQIVIVELKNPQEDLTIDNRAQLQDYMTWMEAHFPGAQLRGYLVGRNTGLQTHDNRMSIVPWTDVLGRARDRNLELLSAMLLLSGATNDTRAVDAINLAGPEAEAFLERLAQDHREIEDLMQTFRKVKR